RPRPSPAHRAHPRRATTPKSGLPRLRRTPTGERPRPNPACWWSRRAPTNGPTTPKSGLLVVAAHTHRRTTTPESGLPMGAARAHWQADHGAGPGRRGWTVV
ncbi:hypothetical protein, partial [Actinocorallia lasiicapitis]